MTSYDTGYIEEILRRIENKLDSLQKQIDELTPKVDSDTTWLTLKELSEYIPSHPSESTIRRMVRDKAIPYSKAGKRLVFQKSDIDQWLLSTRSKSVREVEAEAHKTMATIRRNVAPWRIQSA